MDKNKILRMVFYSLIVNVIIAFSLSDNPPTGWYQQFLPNNLPNITDITFLDSLTGYAVTDVNPDSNSYIMRTTNGGSNWDIVLQDSIGRAFTKIQFVNLITGFACTDYASGNGKLYKTSDNGQSWTQLNNPHASYSYDDMCVVNENEIWVAKDLPFDGGVYRTTNGAQTWEVKFSPKLGVGPDRIYMINSRIGFLADGTASNSRFWKTIDAGDSWTLLSGAGGYDNIFFDDSLRGWKSTDFNLLNTTDGGLNWKTILFSQNGNPSIGMKDFAIIGNSIWGVCPGTYILFPNNQIRGVIFKSTNSGSTWGYQLPDTSINVSWYHFVEFVNSNYGWCYVVREKNVHTTTGGDTTTHPITSIIKNNINLPNSFKLSQNYPNPFNPRTIIEYELKLSNYVAIRVFDIQGKQILTLVNKKQSEGKYQIEFDGSSLTSGIYFYCLIIDNAITDTKKMILTK